MANWGYAENNGPALWGSVFPIAKTGVRQSPVDITNTNCFQDPNLPGLNFNYAPSQIKMINTGSSWKMDFSPELGNLSGGPLADNYKIWQMHAHWGAKSGMGSEHTMNGKMYDAELHMVHYNAKYGQPGLAVDKPDGLAVLGMFIKTGRAHPEFEKLCQNLKEIENIGESIQLQEILNPLGVLPGDKTYFTYPGSLTTPPLLESVTWLVFKEPIEMSSSQLNAMRSLRIGETEDSGCMVNNFRPPCALGQRKIRVCVDANPQKISGPSMFSSMASKVDDALTLGF